MYLLRKKYCERDIYYKIVRYNKIHCVIILGYVIQGEII